MKCARCDEPLSDTYEANSPTWRVLDGYKIHAIETNCFRNIRQEIAVLRGVVSALQANQMQLIHIVESMERPERGTEYAPPISQEATNELPK